MEAIVPYSTTGPTAAVVVVFAWTHHSRKGQGWGSTPTGITRSKAEVNWPTGRCHILLVSFSQYGGRYLTSQSHKTLLFWILTVNLNYSFPSRVAWHFPSNCTPKTKTKTRWHFSTLLILIVFLFQKHLSISLGFSVVDRVEIFKALSTTYSRVYSARGHSVLGSKDKTRTYSLKSLCYPDQWIWCKEYWEYKKTSSLVRKPKSSPTLSMLWNCLEGMPGRDFGMPKIPDIPSSHQMAAPWQSWLVSPACRRTLLCPWRQQDKDGWSGTRWYAQVSLVGVPLCAWSLWLLLTHHTGKLPPTL